MKSKNIFMNWILVCTITLIIPSNCRRVCKVVSIIRSNETGYLLTDLVKLFNYV